MQTLLNIIHNIIGESIEPAFLYLVRSGINPYFIFILFVIFILALYYLWVSLLVYRGDFTLIVKGMKRMSKKNKRNWFIFLFGGVIIAFIMFYQMIGLFYEPAEAARYHFAFIDNATASFGYKMVSFLEKIGIIK
jgi:hypothetical protein